MAWCIIYILDEIHSLEFCVMVIKAGGEVPHEFDNGPNEVPSQYLSKPLRGFHFFV